MFPQSNCPHVELVLSAVVVQQVGTTSQWNISDTHHYLLNFSRYLKTFLFARY